MLSEAKGFGGRAWESQIILTTRHYHSGMTPSGFSDGTRMARIFKRGFTRI
jgi:hypothetical protein